MSPPLLLTKSNSRAVTTLPGCATWVCVTDREGLVITGRPGHHARAATYGGRESFAVPVVAVHGIDATTVALTDGIAVGRFEVGETGPLRRLARWELPGEMGWSARLASSPGGDRVAVSSDRRLGVLGEEQRVITEPGGHEQSFWSLGFLPDGETLAVGRGDGRIELRDGRSLELRRTFPVLRSAVLALCVLDAKTLAVADDHAITGLLHLDSGTFEELDLQRMKTSGLHRLADGRLLAVGLSRRIAVFEGTRRVRGLDLSGELGDRYVQGSAVSGRSLLLACEAAGLLALDLDQLPAETAPAPLQLPPLPPFVPLERAKAWIEIETLRLALENREDPTARVSALLEADDEWARRQVFLALATAEVPLPEAGKYLASPNARVRFYAADAFGHRPALYPGRSAELAPLLDDPDPAVVAAAAWALGRLGDAAHAPALVALLRHPAFHVQTTAAMALIALKTGAEAIADAVRSGAHEHAISAWITLWSPRAGPPLGPEVVERLSRPLPVEDLLQALGFSARPEVLAEHAGAPVQAEGLVPKASALYVFVTTARARGWSVIVEDDAPVVAPHACAADFWARTLRERWQAP